MIFMNRLRGLIGLLAFWAAAFSCVQNADATSPEPFAGIYIAAPYRLNAQRQLPQAVYAMPQANGVYLRVPWNAIEPAPGQFQWDVLDTEITGAVKGGKRISIALLAARDPPAWLEQRGVKMLTFNVEQGIAHACNQIRLPRPWDRGFEDSYIDAENALAAHLHTLPGAYQAVRIVKLSPISQLTEELRIPMTRPAAGNGAVSHGCESASMQTWIDAGYRPELIVDAWTKIADAIGKDFPDKLLALDILERNDFPKLGGAGEDDPGVKDAIIKAGLARFAGRFSVQWDGLTATIDAPVTVSAGRQGAITGFSTNTFRGLDGAGCNPSRRDFEASRAAGAPCDAAGFQAILDHGIALGARYIEVWPPDAMRFGSVVDAANRHLSGQ
jgi:hypothetical protein